MQGDQQISLRVAAETDSDAVYSLKKAAFSHYVKMQYGEWNEAEQREYHIARFVSNDIKIIMVDRRALGFVSIVTEPNCIKVNQLIIHPKHQGQGIGKRCMTFIK